jgi:hypothetical protein
VQLGPEWARLLIRCGAEYAWCRKPRWHLWLLRPAYRIAWLIACPLKALSAYREMPKGVSLACLGRSIWFGWTRGKAPRETMALLARFAGETFSGERRNLLTNSLDARQSILLLNALGDPAEQSLAADKRAMSRALAAIGIPVPPILAELEGDDFLDLSVPPWTDGRRLFLKPRQGAGSRGVAVVERLSTSRILVAGKEMSLSAFACRLSARVSEETILVQPFLETSASMRDISPRAPPWLRITIYRTPCGEPRVLSGTLLLPTKVQGGEAPRTAQLQVPIDPQNGTLLQGLLWKRPRERFAVVPWNGARLAGRAVPEWDEAYRLALRSSTLLPNLPVIGWDVLLTSEGPIVAEANTWIALSSAELWYFEANVPSPLAGVLLRWLEERGGDRRRCSKSRRDSA